MDIQATLGMISSDFQAPRHPLLPVPLFVPLPAVEREGHTGRPQPDELPQNPIGRAVRCPLQNVDCHFPWLNCKAGINWTQRVSACRSVSPTSLLEFLSFPRDERGPGESGGGGGGRGRLGASAPQVGIPETSRSLWNRQRRKEGSC